MPILDGTNPSHDKIYIINLCIIILLNDLTKLQTLRVAISKMLKKMNRRKKLCGKSSLYAAELVSLRVSALSLKRTLLKLSITMR